jgi:hypothetical protein
MCECSDFDTPEFMREATVRARARQRCDECLRSIEPGAEYRKICGKWDREFLTFKTCLGCIALAKRAGVTCWLLGDLMDCLAAKNRTPELQEWLDAKQRRSRDGEGGPGSTRRG